MQRNSGSQPNNIRITKKAHTYGPMQSHSEFRRPPLTTMERNDPRFIINDQLHQKHLKIKTFDQKLQAHRSQIERNNEMINGLIKNLENLKDQLSQQTQLTEAQEKKCKQLRDEMERTNRLLKSKNTKIDQLTKKIETLEKENLEARTVITKAEELGKNLQAARRQSLNLQRTLEEVNSDKKALAKDKDLEIIQLKDKLALATAKQDQYEDLRRSLESKDHELYVLRTENSNMMSRFQKQHQEKNAFKINYETMKRQLDVLIENEKGYLAQQKQRQEDKRQNDLLKEKLKAANYRLDDMKLLQTRYRSLEIQVTELKMKNSERFDTIEHNRNNYEKTLNEKIAAIDNLNGKLTNCQKQVQNLKKDLTGAKKSNAQLQAIRGKSEQLNTLYSNLIPPLQCSFCHHSLSQPITVIPCGHNFCLNCKKGYSKCCSVCGEKVKIEAVYRNELLDDIAQVVKNIKEVIHLVR